MRMKVSFFLIFLISIVIFLTFAPVDVLEISEGNLKLFSRSSPIGARFVTRYIHSVELTPVEDDFRVVCARIWSWEERVLSQNAGMPFVRPRNGRLVIDGEWLRFRGGRYSWKDLVYRVGDDALGKNELIVFTPNSGYYPLFLILPSRRILFSVSRYPLIISIINSRVF